MSCSASCSTLVLQAPVRSAAQQSRQLAASEYRFGECPVSQHDRRRRRKAGLLDIVRLRESFARVAMHGDEVPLFFYSDLFTISMEAQRGHLVNSLVKIVSQVDNLEELRVFLSGLGRDHRKFGAMAE